ncbi:MAG: hypothetical protein Q9195_006841 [Heterodermia aff. obscurata]
MQTCCFVAGLYMYKDQGLDDEQRWKKITDLVNLVSRSLKITVALKNVKQVKNIYERGEEGCIHAGDEWEKWSFIRDGVGNVKVQNKIKEYEELERRMSSGGLKARDQEDLKPFDFYSRMAQTVKQYQYEFMDIWQLDPNDRYYNKYPKRYVEKMMEIKKCILLCADRGIYPYHSFDRVRWKLLSYHLSESSRLKNQPIPRFAEDKWLNGDGCLEFYEQMLEWKDPEIKIWDMLREDKNTILKVRQYLGLGDAEQVEKGKSR